MKTDTPTSKMLPKVDSTSYLVRMRENGFIKNPKKKRVESRYTEEEIQLFWLQDNNKRKRMMAIPSSQDMIDFFKDADFR